MGRRILSKMIATTSLMFVAYPAFADITIIDNGKDAVIDRHGVCKAVRNAGASPIMVPLRSPQEWSVGLSSFLNNLTKMDRVTVSDCVEELAAVHYFDQFCINNGLSDFTCEYEWGPSEYMVAPLCLHDGVPSPFVRSSWSQLYDEQLEADFIELRDGVSSGGFSYPPSSDMCRIVVAFTSWFGDIEDATEIHRVYKKPPH